MIKKLIYYKKSVFFAKFQNLTVIVSFFKHEFSFKSVENKGIERLKKDRNLNKNENSHEFMSRHSHAHVCASLTVTYPTEIP